MINYKCIVTNENNRYFQKINGKWKRISNALGKKVEKNRRKYRFDNDCNILIYLRNNSDMSNDQILNFFKNFYEEDPVNIFDIEDNAYTNAISLMFKDFILQDNVVGIEVKNNKWCNDQVTKYKAKIDVADGDPNGILTEKENEIITNFNTNTNYKLSYDKTISEGPTSGCGAFISPYLFEAFGAPTHYYVLALSFDIN